MSKELDGTFLNFYRVKEVDSKEYDGKKVTYLVFDRVVEDRIRIDDDFKEKLEAGKEYLFQIQKNKYRDKDTKALKETYKIIGVKKW